MVPGCRILSLIIMCEKFNYDRLRNDRALGNGKYDSNKNNNKTTTTFVDIGDPFPDPKIDQFKTRGAWQSQT